MSTPRTIKVFIADDSAAMREHVLELMQDIPGVKIVGFASEGAEAVASIRQLRPDVVLLDIQLPHGSGLDVLRSIKQNGRGPLTIVATNFPYPQYRKRALDLGADYFLDKTTDIEELRGLIAQLTGGLQPAGTN
jgi:DNA-binding NarL/FixJ family response regulator